MRSTATTLAACLAAAGCGTSAADERAEPVFGVTDRSDLVHTSGIYFDCEAPAGLYTHEALAIAETGGVHGSFYIAETRHHETWWPTANVAVAGKDGQVSLLATIDLRRSQLRPEIRFLDRKASTPYQLQTLLPRSTAGIYFEIAWEPTRVRVRLEPGAPWIDVPITFKPEHFELGCSTGNAVFNDVTLEAPPPTATASP